MLVRAWIVGFFLLPTVAFAQIAGPFLDVVGHPHEAYIDLLRTRGIVQGYGYGIFRPDILINRAEFLKILMLAAYGDESYAGGQPRCFTDFFGDEQWFWPHACTAKTRGVIEGYPDGSFQGERDVILAEALKMAVDAWQIPLPQYVRAPDHWYIPYMDIAGARGLFEYFPYNPGHLLTRSEMAYLLVRLGEPIATVGTGPVQPASRSSASSSSRNARAECGNGILEPGEECDDGNTADSDGCSSICIIVAEPVRHAALVIDQRPLGSLEMTQGSRNVVLLSFDASSGRQDTIVTGFTFIPEQGSLAAAANYRIAEDANGDGIPENILGSGNAQGGRLAFDQLDVTVADGATRRFLVLADLEPSGPATSIGLGFATDDPQYVRAVGAEDGRDLLGIETDNAACPVSLCWIGVRTQDPRVVTIAGAGNLYVTKDAVPVPSHQLLAGERSAILLRLTFRATGEDVEVTRIAVGGATTNADVMEFYEQGASQPFATGRTTNCPVLVSGQFCATAALRVPAGSEKSISVRLLVKPDTQGVDTSKIVALTLSSTTGQNAAIEARGAASQRLLSQNDGDASEEGEIFLGVPSPGPNAVITGPAHDVVLSKITGIVNAHTDPDDTPVPAGTQSIGTFRFSSPGNSNTAGGIKKARILQAVFSVTATNVELDPDSFALFNTLDPSIAAPCTANQPTQEITVTCSSLDATSVSTVIDPGSSMALGLRATVTDPAVLQGTSTLQVRLTNLSDRSSGGAIRWHDGSRVLQWVDVDFPTIRSTLYRTR